MTRRIVSLWLVAALALAASPPAFAQTRVERSQRMDPEPDGGSRDPATEPTVATTQAPPWWEIRGPGDPITRDSEHRLFRLELGTGIVLRATCHHVQYFDPCSELPTFLEESGAAQSLAESIKSRLEEQLDARILEALDQSTVEEIRRALRGQRSRVFDGRFVLGAALVATGGVLNRASGIEGPIGSGRVGVTIAAAGVGLMVTPFITRWWSGRGNATP